MLFAEFRSKKKELNLDLFKEAISLEWNKLLSNEGTNTDRLALRFEARKIMISRGYSNTQAKEFVDAATEKEG